MALTSLLALVQARFLYHPIYAYGPDILLITSVGVAFAIQGPVLSSPSSPRGGAAPCDVQ